MKRARVRGEKIERTRERKRERQTRLNEWCCDPLTFYYEGVRERAGRRAAAARLALERPFI